MRFIRFDPVGGASGDMILGALIALGVETSELEAELQRLIPEPFRFSVAPCGSHGLHGTRLTVEIGEPDAHSHHHHHHHLHHHSPTDTDVESGGLDAPLPLPTDPHVAHQHSDTSAHTHRHSSLHPSPHAHEPFDSSPPVHAHHAGNAHTHHSTEYPDGGDPSHHATSHHAHRSFADIRCLIAESSLSEEVKADSTALFEILADAEGGVHGVPAEAVRFHEVGAVDSILDMVGAVWALRRLNVEGVAFSPIPTGCGQVTCAHGVYPVPAPATAKLIERFGLDVVPGGPPRELLTPTGAVLLGFWREHLPVPEGVAARLVRTAESFGHATLADRPNVLRASLYETSETLNRGNTPSPLEGATPTGISTETDTMSVGHTLLVEPTGLVESLFRLECTIDDVSGERLAAAMAEVFAAGALDVWILPAVMKKGRSGHLFAALVASERRGGVLNAMLRHIGTFGVREETVRRYALDRRFETVTTPYGAVRIKIGLFDGVPLHVVPEFDDARAAAMAAGLPVATVFDAALAEYYRRSGEERAG